MSKSNKKEKHNTEVVSRIAEKYGFTPRYIRQILDDDRKPTFADKIKTEYKAAEKAMTDAINKTAI